MLLEGQPLSLAPSHLAFFGAKASTFTAMPLAWAQSRPQSILCARLCTGGHGLIENASGTTARENTCIYIDIPKLPKTMLDTLFFFDKRMLNIPAGGFSGPLFDVTVNETLRRAYPKSVPRKRIGKFQPV